MKTNLILCIFISGFASVRCSSSCGTNPADIHILLESSTNLGLSNFQKLKQYVEKCVAAFPIGPRSIQIGVTTFSSSIHQNIAMNRYRTKASLIHAIASLPYQPGTVSTDIALKYVGQHAFTKEAGDRTRVVNILIVFMASQSDNPIPTIAEALRLQRHNIRVVVVGIGNAVSRSEMEHIASDNRHIFTTHNFDVLTTLQVELKKPCSAGEGKWSKFGSFSPCSKSCGGGTHYRERTCSNPPPGIGGKDCVGLNRDSQPCNIQPCPTVSVTPQNIIGKR